MRYHSVLIASSLLLLVNACSTSAPLSARFVIGLDGIIGRASAVPVVVSELGGSGGGDGSKGEPPITNAPGSGASTGGGGSRLPGLDVSISTAYRFRVQKVLGKALGGNALGAEPLDSELRQVTGIALDRDQTIYVCDRYNNQIRAYPVQGAPFIVAGDVNGAPGFVGDNLPAVSSRLDEPIGLVVDRVSGSLFFCDSGNGRIRYCLPNGRIYSIAGGGQDASETVQYALNAKLDRPFGLALDGEGTFYFTERGSRRLRILTRNGEIKTIATLPTQEIGPLAVDVTGERLWVAQGSDVILFTLNHGSVIGKVTIAELPGRQVRGLAFDGISTLYAYGVEDGPATSNNGAVFSIPLRHNGTADLVQIAGRDGTGNEMDYDVPIQVVDDAKSRLLGSGGYCSLFIDMMSATSSSDLSGILYVGNNFEGQTLERWGTVLRLEPSI